MEIVSALPSAGIPGRIFLYDGILYYDIGTSLRSLPGIKGQMLYNLGDGEDNWVEGYGRGGGSVSKEADHLLLIASRTTGAFNNERSFVLDSPVTMEADDILFVEWENKGGTTTAVESTLVISTDKVNSIDVGRIVQHKVISKFPTGDSNSHNSIYTSIAGTVDISGNNYIKLHTSYFSSSTASTSILKIYRVFIYKADIFANLFL